MNKELFNDIVCDIIERGLSHGETIELIKDYHGINIDFRTKKGKTLLQQLKKAVEREIKKDERIISY